MKIISWNIRGLNGHSKQKLLWDIIIAEKPDIMMLQETKCATEEMDKLLPTVGSKGKVSTLMPWAQQGAWLFFGTQAQSPWKISSQPNGPSRRPTDSLAPTSLAT
jgi:endonuclease/exonuclease/phosphatase family metal-dependent hydrolase